MGVRARRGRALIGISGWRYAGWRGTFYPPGLVQRLELEHASRVLETIELNGSFYSLQRPELYRAWYAATPDGFVFAVKGGRYVTHMKRLLDVETPLANFFASGVLALEEKLGPILWQLPPDFAFDEARIEALFELLPRTTKEAVALARRHDRRVAGRSYLKTKVDRPLLHALEVRHESFRDRRFPALLRRAGVALVVSDNPGHWPRYDDVTAPFVYVRLHGAEELYTSGYELPSLRTWARRIEAWREGRDPEDAALIDAARHPRKASARDVYVYFDNDAKVRAPFDALELRRLLDEGGESRARRAG